MESKIVAEAARATLDGRIPFPEVVRRLLETGVEYYRVDYVELQKTFYSQVGYAARTFNFELNFLAIAMVRIAYPTSL